MICYGLCALMIYYLELVYQTQLYEEISVNKSRDGIQLKKIHSQKIENDLEVMSLLVKY